jgi:hypothetical protein
MVSIELDRFTTLQARIAAMQPPRDASVATAARILFGSTPVAGLAKTFGRPRSTVKAWISGRRRPPVAVLRMLHHLCRQRVIDANVTERELNMLILRREGEPKPLRGCCAVREDGCDRRRNWRR